MESITTRLYTQDAELTEMSVLVVEDNSNMRDQIKRSLSEYNETSKKANFPVKLNPDIWQSHLDVREIADWVINSVRENSKDKKPTVLLLDNAWDAADDNRLSAATYQDLTAEAIEQLPDDLCPGSVRLLRHLRKAHTPDLPVLVWTAHDYSGWNEYLMGDLGVENSLKKVREQVDLLGRLVVGAFRRWYQRVTVKFESGRLIGKSQAIQRLRQQLLTAVESITGNVFLTGDAGVGKTLVADILGKALSFGRKPVKTNITGLTETLLESELFGHKKGAFTGATEKKTGMFELANGGALVLEEIGDLPMQTQAKVLIAVDPKLGGFIHPVGAREDIYVHVRVISSTNRNIPEMVQRREFREDLWQRLSYPHVIRIPTLQERAEDFEEIADALLKSAQIAEGRWWMKFDEAAMDVLKKEFLDSQRQARLLGAGIEIGLAIAGREKSKVVTKACIEEAIRELANRSGPMYAIGDGDYKVDISAGPIDLWSEYERRCQVAKNWAEHVFHQAVKAFDGDTTKALKFCSPQGSSKVYDHFVRPKRGKRLTQT